MKRLIGLVIVALVLLAACGGNNDKKVTIGVASMTLRLGRRLKN
ncbi:hypothetical protein Q268_02309 [Staphylococcus aureus M1289]|nr:hypothetical protein Q305_02252 [Staphylococcus aureus M1334]EWN58128.1 hypothetical protein Q304_01909 [Staphylococcus aureus M1333]EWN66596.1 hypothetical protein Q300_01692 [Staphylococcus aureus M1329]EWO34195.1 hypothetical protein Q269_02153 [Staphylococcus aureus M1290]EWO38834.1 hypothetical protein Q268_02309 [Staphylococcus aureus M1289]